MSKHVLQHIAFVSQLTFMITDTCGNTYCGRGKTCISDGVTLEHKCVCDTECPEKSKPVCASDGRTYKNKCEMRLRKCLTRKSIAVVHLAACVHGKL